MEEKSTFRFYRTITLLESTGIRASDLSELLAGIQNVDDLSIAYHMLTPLFLSHLNISDRMNDFSNWVLSAVHEKELSEKLTAIDPYHLRNISQIRNNLESTLSAFLSRSKSAWQVRRGEEFFFHTISRIEFPTTNIAHNLSEFVNILEHIDATSIFYHFIEPRVGIRSSTEGSDDFSVWIVSDMDNPALSKRLSEVDPYLLTLEEIRNAMLSIIKPKIQEGK